MAGNARCGLDWSGPNGCRCNVCVAYRINAASTPIWEAVRDQINVGLDKLNAALAAHDGDDEDEYERARRG
jgi:hypothetical protein